ncbi:MAG TPA: hypothetical protein VHQ47_01175 [Phycisphaerae bacterium]|nr:hypothetical protein [Phycisphaerae bacterium]
MRGRWAWRAAVVVVVGMLTGNGAASGAGDGETFAAWLEQHPQVKARVAWVTGDGGRVEYGKWTSAQKARVEELYGKLMAGDRNLGMHLPEAEKASGYYTVEQAFDIYAAHVAHVVYVEAKGLVPWKVEDLPADELDALVSAESYFAMIKPTGQALPAGIQARRDFQDVSENEWLGEYISDPRIGYEFLSGKTSTTGRSLIGKNRWETVKNITIWMRDNVDHGGIDDQVGTRAKKLRWLDERLRRFPGQQTVMANQGCHSASKLFVDLARSVNIPILSVRSLDPTDGQKKENYFSRTHGSLIYGWMEASPRVVWHTDEIYAREGRICFPIDEKGALLPKAEADNRYAEQTWLAPAQWKKAGFAYELARVFPGKGFGHDSPKDENRYDLGYTDGAWRGMGKGDISTMFDWAQDYALCGYPLLDLAGRQVVTAQLQIDFKDAQKNLSSGQLPKMPTMAEFESRAAAGLKAVGGEAGLTKRQKAMEAARGKEVLKAGVVYDGRKG